MNKKQATLHQIHDTFLHNIQVIKKQWPHIYQKIINLELKHSEIYVDEQGSVQLVINGIPFYPKDPAKLAIQAVQSFLTIPTRVVLYPDYAKRSWGMTDAMTTQISQLAQSLENISKYYYADSDTIPLLLMGGIGLGHQLETLLSQVNVKRMILYEPDLELFFLSLHTVNWEAVIDYFNQEGRAFYFIYGEYNDEIRAAIMGLIGMEGKHLVSNISYFVHYDSAHLRMMYTDIKDKGFMLTRGYGFYDDERFAIEHTVHNMESQYPILAEKNIVPEDAVAFIIGAGPSLDNSFSLIEKYQGKAVIFAAGSALDICHRRGLSPDFYVVLERTAGTVQWLRYLVDDKAYLKNIRILASNTVYPGVYDMFSKHFMFLKPTDAGSELIDATLKRPQMVTPTCVNAALAMALFLGFKKVYLFGVDFGSLQKDKHHAKDASHYDMEIKKHQSSFEYEQVEEENGRIIYTTQFLYWARKCLEDVVDLYSTTAIYNVSQGLVIKGTTELEIDAVKISVETDKASILSAIEKSATVLPYDREKITILLEPIRDNLKIALDALLACVAEKAKCRNDIIDIFKKLRIIQQQTIGIMPVISTMLSGHIQHYQMVVYTNAMMMQHEYNAVKFANQAALIFQASLVQIWDDFNQGFMQIYATGNACLCSDYLYDIGIKFKKKSKQDE